MISYKWTARILTAELLLAAVTTSLSSGIGITVAKPGIVTASSDATVEYFGSAAVRRAFANGKPLLTGGDGRNFKVMGLRRHGPGEVEVHDADTDIFYVVEGHATFVTGGTLTGGKDTAADEIRGGTLAGGETRHLAQGDVIVIPKGVPHWFKDVPDSIEYFVVKVR
jgi:mannose-6-phosphate isomerase-like protein (cupin superfamily)